MNDGCAYGQHTIAASGGHVQVPCSQLQDKGVTPLDDVDIPDVNIGADIEDDEDDADVVDVPVVNAIVVGNTNTEADDDSVNDLKQLHHIRRRESDAGRVVDDDDGSATGTTTTVAHTHSPPSPHTIIGNDHIKTSGDFKLRPGWKSIVQLENSLLPVATDDEYTRGAMLLITVSWILVLGLIWKSGMAGRIIFMLSHCTTRVEVQARKPLHARKTFKQRGIRSSAVNNSSLYDTATSTRSSANCRNYV